MAQPDYDDMNYQTDFVPEDPVMGFVLLIVFYIVIPACIWGFFILLERHAKSKLKDKPKNPYLTDEATAKAINQEWEKKEL